MNKILLPLLLVSAVALSGCGKKKEEAPAPTPPAQQPAATAKPSAVDQAKQVAADVAANAKKAGEQVVEQGKQVVAQTTEQAKAAAADLQKQAETAVTSAADSFKAELAETANKAVESAKSLLSNPQVTEPVKAELTKLIDGVMGNQDGAATSALSKIVSLKPSESQMTVVKELQSNLGVLVLGRNFDQNDPASGGVVKQTIDAIKAKDTASIFSGLQKLGSDAKFTDTQKQMLGNLLGSYNGKLAGVTDSVNKASDALKGFGF